MTERQDPHPFREPFKAGAINLENSRGGPSMVREFESNKERVVRVHQLDSSNLPAAPKDVDRIKFWVEESAELVRKTEACLSEISKYVAVPKHQFALGNRSRDVAIPSIYTVTDRVVGRPLNEEIMAKDSALSNEALETFFKNLIDYYKDSFYGGKDVLTDAAHIKQFMYGTTVSDPDPKIYLVDLDTLVSDSRGRQAYLTGVLSRSLSDIETMLATVDQDRGLNLEAKFRDELELA